MSVKTSYEKVRMDSAASFKVTRFVGPRCLAGRHIHPEVEIVYMLKGDGIRYVGDGLEPFSSPELVMVGGMLPHYWINGSSYYAEGSKLSVDYILVQFGDNLFPSETLEMPEFQNINRLLGRLGRGLKFDNATLAKCSDLIFRLLAATGINRYSELLILLDTLGGATSGSVELASLGYAQPETDQLPARLKRVLQFVSQNFMSTITLDEVADHANMNRSALCRYFKERVGKTLTSYVNEVRIGYACKLIIDQGFSISQVAYESGYRSLSHFNHIFKQIVGCAPSEYRKNIMQNSNSKRNSYACLSKFHKNKS